MNGPGWNCNLNRLQVPLQKLQNLASNQVHTDGSQHLSVNGIECQLKEIQVLNEKED